MSIISILTIQNCTTTEKVATDKKNAKSTEIEDEELYKELQSLKSMLGHAPDNTATTETNKIEQPLEFGISVSKVQEMFPAPGRFAGCCWRHGHPNEHYDGIDRRARN